MRIIKKIFLTSLVLIISLLFIKLDDKVYLADSSSFYGEIIIGFVDEDNVMKTNLNVDIYDATPVYENGEIIRFNHEYVNTYEVTKEGISIDKPSQYMLIKVNLQNIPSEYGIDTQSFFVNSNCNLKYFSIKKIYDVSIESYGNNQNTAIFTSNDNKQIYAEYNLSIENDLCTVTNHNKKYYVSFPINIIEEEQTNFLYNDGSSVTEYSYYPNNYENDSSKFVVKYNPNTMTEQNAIKVFNTITDINQYLCSNNGFNFPEPKTSNDDFVIELVLAENIDKINEQSVDAITYSYLNENDEVESYIKLQYEYLTTMIPSEMSKYKVILAHEYFHAIIAEMTQSTNDEYFNWINESFSTFIAILYASDRNIESAAIKAEYKNLLRTFYNMKGTSFDQFYEIEGMEYASFIFPLYLYQVYGINFIKNIILNYEYTTNSLDVFYDVLEAYDTSFNSLFKDFSTSLLFAEYNFPSIDDYYTSVWNAWVIEYYELSPNSSSYNKNNINTSYLSNSYFRTKFETCEYHDMYVTVEVNGSSNYNLIYGTLGDNGFTTYNANLTDRFVTIPCLNYGSSEKREWRCTVNNNTGIQELTTINYSVTLEHKDLTIHLGETKSAIEHFHSRMSAVRYKFTPTITNFYEFTIDTINESGSTMNGMYLKIVDENDQVIAQTNNSNTFLNSNSIYALLISNNVYYLDIEYLPNNSSFYYKCDITLSNINYKLNIDYENLIDSSEYYIKQGDNAISINTNVNGVFNVNIDFNELTNISFNYKIYELVGNSLNTIYQGIVNNSNPVVSYNIDLNKNYKYFVVFENSPCVLNYYIKLERYIQKTLELQTDYSANVTLGSEVRLRGSELNGTTIMEGYTRSLYVFSDGEYKSRLNYDLVSTNTNVAIVTDYGTIIAKSVSFETTVKIIAINKNNYGEYGCIELTILPDTSNEIKIVELTTDERVVGTPYGTEVSINGGNPGENTIHIGYNRFICFESGNPSDSIQDFIWASSNSNVARVSSYGTITGIGVGECIIEGTYKYNSNFKAFITISVYNL